MMATGPILEGCGPHAWSICDEVTQFRRRGTRIEYPLPPKYVASTIGASRDCGMWLRDPKGYVSRIHAELTYGTAGWVLADLGSKNGLFLDGVRVQTLSITPGAEIGIGSLTLIAESPKLLALRALLERLIGSGDERRRMIDEALFSLRIAATRRELIQLCGEGNLVAVARALHQQVREGRPFVVATACSPPAKRTIALTDAAGGTLCVSRRDQPDNFDHVVSALRGAQSKSLLMVCTDAPLTSIWSQVIRIPRSEVAPVTARAAALRPRGWRSSPPRRVVAVVAVVAMLALSIWLLLRAAGSGAPRRRSHPGIAMR